MPSEACAVVLGGSTAGYSIAYELSVNGVAPIALVDTRERVATRSRRIDSFARIEPTAEALREALRTLHERHGRLVLFPTLDEHLEWMHAVYDDLRGFCHLPFNRHNLLESLDKIHQYDACERLGVPYPRTRYLRRLADYDALADVPLPLLVKPQEKTAALIQPRLIESAEQLAAHRETVAGHLAQGIQYLASDFVPGDGSNVYAYVGLRSADGRILNDWVGKKLSQYPHEFGVFASASNQGPPEVAELGRRLLEGMDLQGIVEPEFKYDARDGTYKLMEINLRSMGWVHVGFLSGVPLHYCQWLHATGREVPRYVQDQTRDIHYILLQNEVSNLLHRKRYARVFRDVFRGGDRRVFAMYDPRDPRPFLFVLRATALIAARRARAWLGGRGVGEGPARPEAA